MARKSGLAAAATEQVWPLHRPGAGTLAILARAIAAGEWADPPFDGGPAWSVSVIETPVGLAALEGSHRLALAEATGLPIGLRRVPRGSQVDLSHPQYKWVAERLGRARGCVRVEDVLLALELMLHGKPRAARPLVPALVAVASPGTPDAAMALSDLCYAEAVRRRVASLLGEAAECEASAERMLAQAAAFREEARKAMQSV
jgi:hypothetical protein